MLGCVVNVLKYLTQVLHSTRDQLVHLHMLYDEQILLASDHHDTVDQGQHQTDKLPFCYVYFQVNPEAYCEKKDL